MSSLRCIDFAGTPPHTPTGACRAKHVTSAQIKELGKKIARVETRFFELPNQGIDPQAVRSEGSNAVVKKAVRYGLQLVRMEKELKAHPSTYRDSGEKLNQLLPLEDKIRGIAAYVLPKKAPRSGPI